MASTYSTNLAIELIGTGDQAGSWGNTTNTNLGTLIEQAISGYVTQAVSTGTDTTITIPNGATGVARNMYIELTGTGGASTNLIVPANKKLYFIFNNSTGAVTVKVSGQTGVSVPQGKKMVLVSNGTDVVVAENYIADFGSNSATITNLTCTSLTLSNNPTFSGGTANGVLYLNGSKVATSGSALTFDGNGLNVTKTTATFGVPVYQFNAGAVNGIFTGDTTLSTVSLGSYSNHALAFYTNNTLRATLDTSGNLGLGVTPFGWNSSYKAFDLGSGALMGRASNTDTYLLSNAYLGASTFQYKYTAAASYYSQAAGVHYWWNAPSGTAGNPISFTQAMTLDASGNLLLGGTSTTQLDGVFGQIIGSSSKTSAGIALETSAGAYMMYTDSTDSLIFWDSGDNAARATINASGNLGVGATSPSATFRATVQGVGTSGNPMGGVLFRQGATDVFSISPVSTDNTTDIEFWNYRNGYTRFGTNNTERGRFSAGGDLLVGTTGNARNGLVVYYASYDTVNAHSGNASGSSNSLYTGWYGATATTAGTLSFNVTTNGNVTNTNGSYGTISDARLKQDIVDAGSQWDDLKSIRFRKYRMKTDVEANPDAPAMFGVVAQELAQVCPGLVDEHPNMKTVEVTDEEGNVTKTQEPDGTTTMTVKSSILLMKAAKALQEAMARIESLEADVAALKGAK